MAIMASGSVSATASQRPESRDREKPSSSERSRLGPSAMLSMLAAMLGPAIATTLSTAPAGVPIPSGDAARPIQIAQEIPYERMKKVAT